MSRPNWTRLDCPTATDQTQTHLDKTSVRALTALPEHNKSGPTVRDPDPSHLPYAAFRLRKFRSTSLIAAITVLAISRFLY